MEWRTREATTLLTYLWDNYIELNEATHVFLLGTNTGHGAIINFIKANEDRAQEKLTRAISFVEDVPLQSCKSSTNDTLALWYYALSLIFVTPDHNFWFSELSRKPRKRFGKVNKSLKETITDMLIEHRDIVFDVLRSDTAIWAAREPQKNNGEDMMDSNIGGSLKSPEGMPPVSNFALSPRPKVSSALAAKSPSLPPAEGFASQRGRGTRSPRTASPQTDAGKEQLCAFTWARNFEKSTAMMTACLMIIRICCLLARRSGGLRADDLF